MKKAHWSIIFLLFAISCLDQPDCFRLNNNIVGISFRKMYDGKADTVAIIGAQALNANDTTFSKFKLTPEVYLPLDFFETQTAFTIASLTGTNHLLFKYDVKTQFVSDDCGARYVLTNLSLAKGDYDYDSVQLVSTVPYVSAAGVHLYVYRCPRTNLMKLTLRQLQGETSVALAPKIAGIVPDYTGAIFVDTTLSIVNLPLNPNKRETRFNFNFRDYASNFIKVQYDTVKWDYKNQYCGTKDLKVYHKLTIGAKGAGYDFDSVRIFKDTLQDPPVTNIAVYRCPDMGFMRVAFRTGSAPVTADSLEVTRLTDDRGTVLYENVKLAAFTLPLLSDATSTEFTFELKDGSTRKLKINYTPDSKQVFAACGVQTTFNTLSIASTDFTTQPGSTTAPPKVDHTTFPISTNFEIIK